MASFDDSEDGVFALSKALAEAEAEFDATLNGSIGDIEKVTRQNNKKNQRAGGSGSLPVGADTGSQHSDDLSLDGEVDNLEGFAMEDLAKELRALDEMEWTDPPHHSIAGPDGPDAMNPKTTSCRAPFEGKGRRARARRARIKREIKAREEKATKNGSTSNLPSPSSSSSLGKSAAASPTRPSGTGNNAKPLKSIATSSLGRALAESKASGSRSAPAHMEAAEGGTMTNWTLSRNTTYTSTTSNASNSASSKKDNKRYDGENGGRGKSRHGSCRQKQHGGSDVAGSKPHECKGRRARARRAKERREAKQAPASTKDDARDKGNEKLASAPAIGRDNMDSSQRQDSNSGCTDAEEEKDTKPFPDFSLRRAIFSEE